MSPSVFISYRRSDVGPWVGRVYDRLTRALGSENVFADVDRIQPGSDFLDSTTPAIAKATTVLVIIGPNWLNSTNATGDPRIRNRDDWVRLEIATAFSLGKVVIPVLVDQAMMPMAADLPTDIARLARLNALRLGFDSFSSDIERLLDAILRVSTPDSAPIRPRARLTVVGEELRAVAMEFFSAAGRAVSTTLDRRLLGPEPILIVDSNSLTETDIADIGSMSRGQHRLYLIHPDQLSDSSTGSLDRLRAHGTAIVPLSSNTMSAALADGRSRTILLEVEREYGSDRNLFETKNSVIDERFLFGRSELLTRLGGSIAAADSVLLTGLRKAGKTSVLNILRQHLIDYPVCHVDLQRFNRSDAHWPRLLHELMLNAYDRWGGANCSGWNFRAPYEGDAYYEMERRREHQVKSGPPTPFVILLDELERVLPLPGDVDAASHYARASGLIRALAQSQPGWIALIAADLRPTANRTNLLPNGETNPLFQFFGEIPLRLLAEDAVDEMIRSLCNAMGVWDVRRQVSHTIFELSGGHPALVRMLSGASYRARRDTRRLQVSDLRRGLHSLAESNLLGSFFAENFWAPMTGPEKQVVVEAVALQRRWLRTWRAVRSPGGEAEAEARAALAGQGLVRDEHVAVGAFGDWVRARNHG